MDQSVLLFGAFVVLGWVVGAYGSLIGVGGGFLLVPVLLWLYPGQRPEIIASISLSVVFFNALSGSIAYARMRRIDYKSGLLFAAAALPGTVLGALSTEYIPRNLFDGIVGGFLVLAALLLLLDFHWKKEVKSGSPRRHITSTITDSHGVSHTIDYNPRLGMALSSGIGYLSSILGIGGGIIRVPILVQLLNFPIHVATATSHFILAIMAFSGSMTHFISGDLAQVFGQVIPISIGVVIGAQMGARLSYRVRGVWIMRALALALLLAGLRTFWGIIH